jgi:hypothetical protein
MKHPYHCVGCGNQLVEGGLGLLFCESCKTCFLPTSNEGGKGFSLEWEGQLPTPESPTLRSPKEARALINKAIAATEHQSDDFKLGFHDGLKVALDLLQPPASTQPEQRVTIIKKRMETIPFGPHLTCHHCGKPCTDHHLHPKTKEPWCPTCVSASGTNADYVEEDPFEYELGDGPTEQQPNTALKSPETLRAERWLWMAKWCKEQGGLDPMVQSNWDNAAMAWIKSLNGAEPHSA